MSAVVIVATIFAIVMVYIRIGALEKFIANALCELMTAVYNQDAVKAKCQEAARNGEKYVEL